MPSYERTFSIFRTGSDQAQSASSPPGNALVQPDPADDEVNWVLDSGHPEPFLEMGPFFPAPKNGLVSSVELPGIAASARCAASSKNAWNAVRAGGWKRIHGQSKDAPGRKWPSSPLFGKRPIFHLVFEPCGSNLWRSKPGNTVNVIPFVRFRGMTIVGGISHSKARCRSVSERELTDRMRKSTLELHPEKTATFFSWTFGPYAIDQREWRGEG